MVIMPIDMPSNCIDCPCHNDDRTYCQLLKNDKSDWEIDIDLFENRRENCPLVEVLMQKDKIKDRVAGAMYGVAVGDALGGPLEFMTEAEIKEKYGVITEMIGGGWLNLAPGETTDDTAMTLAVAEGIMAAGDNYKDREAVAAEVGRNYIEWYHGNPKDIGATCAAVIANVDASGRCLLDGWLDAAIEYDELSGGKSGGNGALMRAVPAAIIYNDNDDGKTMWKALALMTHWDHKAADLVVDYSRMISRGARYDFKIIDYIDFSEKYKQTNITPSGYSFESMAAAIWACETTNFENSLIRAVNLGGDADTIGAIAGGMAGVCYGYSEIPARWIKALPDDIKARIDRFVDWAVEKIMEEG